jgi:hypothetical protein
MVIHVSVILGKLWVVNSFVERRMCDEEVDLFVDGFF